MVRGHYCMYRQFRLLALGVADGFIMRMGRVYRTTVEDNPIHSALMQSAIKLLFSVTFSEKFRMTDFDAVGKHLWQGIEKMPESREIAWAKGGGQLQPVLTDAAFQRRHSGQEFVLQIIAIAQGRLMGNGRREFKTETKCIRRLCVPACHNLRFWQRIQRGVAFHTVNMTGVSG